MLLENGIIIIRKHKKSRSHWRFLIVYRIILISAHTKMYRLNIYRTNAAAGTVSWFSPMKKLSLSNSLRDIPLITLFSPNRVDVKLTDSAHICGWKKPTKLAKGFPFKT
jgi:hypothetical protein